MGLDDGVGAGGAEAQRPVVTGLVGPVDHRPHVQSEAAEARGPVGRRRQQAVQRLDERGVPLVFLEGDPRFYSRVGFSPAVEFGFRKPSLRIPDDGFQVVELSAYEPWMTGTFVYPNTFWELDCVGLRDTTQGV